MEEKIRIWFHFLIVSCYVVASAWALFLCDFESVEDDRVLDMQKYGGRYFTTWNFLFQLTYFSIALAEDFLITYTPCESCLNIISKLKGYLFSSFVVPYTTYMFIVFWTLFNYDRELVFPLVTDEVVPLWFNHTVHTMTFVFMILEFYFTESNVIPDEKIVLAGFLMVTSAYFYLMFDTASRTGRYFYGIFHQLASWQIVLFVITSFLVGGVAIKGGLYIQQMVQSSKIPSIAPKRKASESTSDIY